MTHTFDDIRDSVAAAHAREAANAALDALAETPPQAPVVTLAELWAYAVAPEQVVSLKIRRALAGDPALAQRYRAMLGQSGGASSGLLKAAHGSGPLSRRIGEARLTLHPGAEGLPDLLVIEGVATPSPRVLTVDRGESFVDWWLPQAVDGVIQVYLPAQDPEAIALKEGLAGLDSILHLR